MMYFWFQKIKLIIPPPVSKLFKIMGLDKLYRYSLGMFLTKKSFELEAQMKRAREFKNPELRSKALEYYQKYRYLEEIKKMVNFGSAAKILDIGCGIKTVLHFLPGEKYGLDPLAKEYRKIYDYPSDIRIIKGGGESIPFSENIFDVVFCTNALDHAENPARVVQEIYRVIKPDGFFILIVELIERVRRSSEGRVGHPHDLTAIDVEKLLDDKFQVIFKKTSPFIGIREYYLGRKKEQYNDELIIVAKVIK